jgi:hypothetical protein
VVEVFHKGYHCGNLCRDLDKWAFTVGADPMKYAQKFASEDDAERAKKKYLSTRLSFKVPVATSREFQQIFKENNLDYRLVF